MMRKDSRHFPSIESTESSYDTEFVRNLGKPGLIQLKVYSLLPGTVSQLLANCTDVTSFHINTVVSGDAIPNDSDFPSLIGLHNVGQFGSQPDADIDAVEAWEQIRGSPSVVVGIIDSGIDVTHPDLYLNVWINQGEIPNPLRNQIVDTDRDGIVSFYDLNDQANRPFVRDINQNGYIDADDLLKDAAWADGLDTDSNGFVDDFFGWNFRNTSDEPFAPNNPRDSLGHGTHVAGIVGAVGNNTRGVTGVNWQTSLMSLKFLDANNQGDLASAIAAINYASMMRSQFKTNVRVLNASWGQSGSANSLLEESIRSAGDSGILFVAAAGNGNVLGQGLDNDRIPFYPASLTADNILSVGASDASDQPASFSNFGKQSVDVFAPGVGIRSTLPNGRYGEANGTSMSAPFVSGTAALIWSQIPNALVSEVHTEIIDTADRLPQLTSLVASGARLNANNAVRSTRFAPQASVIEAPDVTTQATSYQFTVRYEHPSKIQLSSLGDDDLLVMPQWGIKTPLAVQLVPSSIRSENNGKIVFATYSLKPPGGEWDPLDFGQYEIALSAGSIESETSIRTSRSLTIGVFEVRVAAPNVHYVNTLRDSTDPGSLRSVLAIANRDPTNRHTIVLAQGRYTIDVPRAGMDVASFVTPNANCNADSRLAGWSNESSGDFDIFENVLLVGDSSASTIIDGNQLDRVFKVHPNGILTLNRVSVTGGNAPLGQGGGGILSAGTLQLVDSQVFGNQAFDSSAHGNFGGGVALWDGNAKIIRTRIHSNESKNGGGVFACGDSSIDLQQSTLDNNRGAAFVSFSTADSSIVNTTIASNTGGGIASRNRLYEGGDAASFSPRISRDGSKVAFLSDSNRLSKDDTNNAADVFVYDVSQDAVRQVSLSTSGAGGNRSSAAPSINGDGRSLLFSSTSTNLVSGDDLFSNDLFLRTTNDSATMLLTPPNIRNRDVRGQSSQSDDGRFVVLQQSTPNDPNNDWGVFLFDRSTGAYGQIRLSIGSIIPNTSYLDQSQISGDGQLVVLSSVQSGTADDLFHEILVYDRSTNTTSSPIHRTNLAAPRGSHYQAIPSANGNFIAFTSDDTGLVNGDTNGTSDIFVWNRIEGTTKRMSLASGGVQANRASMNPSISATGRFIAFSSLATNLVIGDTNQSSDVFVVDSETSEVDRISIGFDGENANGESSSPSISGDGRYIAFESTATNLTSDTNSRNTTNTNPRKQVYLFDRQIRTTLSISAFYQSSDVSLDHATVAFNSGTFSLEGNIESQNSLFAGNRVAFDWSNRVESLGSNVLASTANPSGLRISDIIAGSNALRLSDFASNAIGLPPSYSPLRGNPVIDAANAGSIMVDQWGRTRTQPDIGALEAVTGNLFGSVFADLNANTIQDAGEPGLNGIQTFIDSNQDGLKQSNEAQSESEPRSNPNSVSSGVFSFTDLIPGDYQVRTTVPSSWTASSQPIQRIANSATQPNGDSRQPKTGHQGHTIAFTSSASNWVPNDSTDINAFVVRDSQAIEKIPINGSNIRINAIGGSQEQWVLLRNDDGIYLYDTQQHTTTLVSRTNSGQPANAYSDHASMSDDGNWIVFSSFASNLDSQDNDQFADVFLVDRRQNRIESITRSALGILGNQDSEEPTISDDGRFIAFVSDASNLVSNDRNGVADIFVFDRESRSIRRISLSDSGAESDAISLQPAISGNGRFVVFQSLASNLVTNDRNGTSNLFVFDLVKSTIERLDVPFPANAPFQVFDPTINDDGQYVSFQASSSLLDASDQSSNKSIYIYDRFAEPPSSSGSVARLVAVSQSIVGAVTDGSSLNAVLSGDGKRVVFESTNSKLVSNDTNPFADIFQTGNPFEANGRSISISAGEVVQASPIGLVPNLGSIRGSLYEDLDSSDSYSFGEAPLANWTVYLDLNRNLKRDPDEPIAASNADGSYEFARVGSYRELAVNVETPSNWEPSIASPSNRAPFFLGPGAQVLQRDFGFRQKSSNGQSTNSRIEGKVFEDTNGNGTLDSNEFARASVELYLDLNQNGRRDFDEPRTTSGSNGNYSFGPLGYIQATVRASLDEGTTITNPVGNRFTSIPIAFAAGSTALTTPTDVAIADFDGRLGPDIAIAMTSANRVAILLNDGQGGYRSEPINIDIAPNGKGPIALVTGDVDKSGATDLIVANAFNNTITVLRNLNGNQFRSTATFAVGANPTELQLADIDFDQDLDLVVAVQGADGSGQIRTFLNDGSGNYTAYKTQSTAGKRPVSLVLGRFNQDNNIDLAVVNLGDAGRAGDNGSVAVLIGSADGTFSTPMLSLVGLSPSSIDSGDLDSDGDLDLVVSNFASNTASVLRGRGDGAFDVLGETLSLGQGPIQVSLVDIDRDQDIDILASNLRVKSVSILRNRQSQLPVGQRGGIQFEPAEGFGVAEFSAGPRLVFDTADLDGSGTSDLVLIDSQSNSARIFRNEQISGAHRVALSGTNTVSQLDFALNTQVLSPQLDPIIGPSDFFEDFVLASITLTGIAKGRASGPPMRWTITSSNTAVLPTLTLRYTDGAAVGQLELKSALNAVGTSEVILQLRNAGIDNLFDNADDGLLQRSFAVRVKPVNDPPNVQLVGDQLVTYGSNLRTVNNFAFGFAPGGGTDEQSQAVSEYIVSTSPTELFRVQPQIDNQGTLRFQPALNRAGVATITVQVRDNGGIENGGQDRSVSQSFKITVTDLADGDIDFGDAPFLTLLAQDGARHRIGDLFLGLIVDPEPNGQPSNNALGDNAGVRDEDGIRFASTSIAFADTPTISSFSAVASKASKLDAWIDFNQDGDWSDSGEQIVANSVLNQGKNLVPYTIPAGAKPGSTFARFRLSSIGGLSPIGLAEDGEVEDYAIQIVDGQSLTELFMDASILGTHDLQIVGGSLTVRQQSRLVLSVPAEFITRVALQGPDQSVVYAVLQPQLNLIGTVRYAEETGEVTLRITRPTSNLSSNAGGKLVGFDRIELDSPLTQTLQFDANAIRDLNNSQDVLLSLGQTDRLESTSAWRIVDRRIIDGELLHRFEALSQNVRVAVRSPLTWQNSLNPLDADGDGSISPLDVLVVINFLNARIGSSLPQFDANNPLSTFFVDVNGNNQCEPLDVLIVINALNSKDRNGEGEGSSHTMISDHPTRHRAKSKWHRLSACEYENTGWKPIPHAVDQAMSEIAHEWEFGS